MATNIEDILDYLASGSLCLGTVLKEGDGRIQVKAASDVSTKVPVKQILVNHGPAGAAGRKALVKVQNDILEAMSGIDTAFIWEIFAENPGEHSLEEIADGYFGDRLPVHVSALARKLAEDTEHFQWPIQGNSVKFIKVRSVEEAAEVVRLRALRAEKAAQRERIMQWMSDTLAYPQQGEAPVPEEFENTIMNSIEYLTCGTNTETVNLLSRLSNGSSARENALRLLKQTGRMPDGVDEFLLANGIHAGFSRSVMDYADGLSADFATEGRSRLEGELVFSIDDEETREIDDALSCRKEGDEYVIGVYIADPACYVSKDDPLDEVAAERPLSLYLPTTMVKMFPDHLSCDLASLKQGEARPCLAFHLRMNGEGEILDWSLESAIVTVNRRLTYDEADRMMADGTGDEVSEALKGLLEVADASRRYRELDGAVVLNRPELRIRVRDGEVTVGFEDQESPSHRMVAEFMVLSNHLAAKYALRNEIPVIYRVQDPPSGPVVSVHKYEPYFFEQQVRRMKRTRLSTYPQPHFGLGLDLYIQISSPLRRYADLVMHRQLAAHCVGKPVPYTQEELFVVLDKVDRTAGLNRSLEREANSYWLLEYLRRNFLGKNMGATVVRVEGTLVLAELDDYCERGVVMTRDKPMPGERITVTIKDIFPDARRMVLQRV